MTIITSMVNILVNDTNFDANWAYPSLNEYFTKDSKVVVVPFMHSDEYSSDEEEWDYYFKKGGKIYEKIVAPFKNYGIKEKNITIKKYNSIKNILHSSICLKIPVLH